MPRSNSRKFFGDGLRASVDAMSCNAGTVYQTLYQSAKAIEVDLGFVGKLFIFYELWWPGQESNLRPSR